MKKFKLVVISVLAFFISLVGTNVYAEEAISSQYIKDIFVTNGEQTGVANPETTPYVKFSIKSAMEYTEEEVELGTFGIQAVFIDKNGMEYPLLFAKSTDNTITGSDGTLGELPNAWSYPYTGNLNVGDIILGHYEFYNENLAALTKENIASIKFTIRNKDFDEEISIFDIATNKFTSCEVVHNTNLENLTNVYTKYNGFPVNIDDETGTITFYLNVVEEDTYASYNEVSVNNFYDKTYEEICAEIDKALEKATLNYSLSDNKLTEDLLTQIKTNQDKVNVVVYDDNSPSPETLATWTFDGSKITSTDFNIDLGIKVGETTNKETIGKLIPEGYDKPLYLEFLHSGDLPIGTQVTVNVSKQFKDDEKLVLQYYNPDTKELETIANNLYVKNGAVTFDLAHCSEYVLSRDNTPEADNNGQTSSINKIPYIILAIGSFAGIAYLVASKKKDNLE